MNIKYFNKNVKKLLLQNTISILMFGTKKCDIKKFDMAEMLRIFAVFCSKHRKNKGGIEKNSDKCYNNQRKKLSAC